MVTIGGPPGQADGYLKVHAKTIFRRINRVPCHGYLDVHHAPFFLFFSFLFFSNREDHPTVSRSKQVPTRISFTTGGQDQSTDRYTRAVRVLVKAAMHAARDDSGEGKGEQGVRTAICRLN